MRLFTSTLGIATLDELCQADRKAAIARAAAASRVTLGWADSCRLLAPPCEGSPFCSPLSDNAMVAYHCYITSGCERARQEGG